MSELERLIEAAKRGDLGHVKHVLESHAELVHERDQSGATALHYATSGGHRSVVETRLFSSTGASRPFRGNECCDTTQSIRRTTIGHQEDSQ
jgi:hypothetical protein